MIWILFKKTTSTFTHCLCTELTGEPISDDVLEIMQYITRIMEGMENT